MFLGCALPQGSFTGAAGGPGYVLVAAREEMAGALHEVGSLKISIYRDRGFSTWSCPICIGQPHARCIPFAVTESRAFAFFCCSQDSWIHRMAWARKNLNDLLIPTWA